MLKYVSLFSGIEAASAAWQPLGWQALAFSEIDPFPSAVLKERFPNVPNLGDITKINWTEFKEQHGISNDRPLDLTVGGSPCQSFSVAGNREGLEGESRLMFEYIRAVRELVPTWLVWENVPGALNSDGGRAFHQLLSELADLGYGLAWRVLDAQFFGVAQRRRRVFLIGHLRDHGRPFKVLFNGESVSGDFTTGARERERLTASRDIRTTATSVGLTPGPTPKTSDNVAPTLTRHDGASGSRTSVVTYGLPSLNANAGISANLQGTLTVGGSPPAVVSIQGNVIGRQPHNGPAHGGMGLNEDVAPTLTTRDRHAVLIPTAFKVRQGHTGSGGRGGLASDNLAFTLATQQDQHIAYNGVARTLTPRECERLQGFPDDWTQIPWKGKPASECPDAPRYKACGNSMAVPVMRWLGQRIQENHNYEKGVKD